MWFQFLEGNFTLRTRAGHDYQCGQIDLDEELSKVYGVCRQSSLCRSRYYHVIDGLPGDAMHDVLEGVLQYQCKELLRCFIQEDKYFSLADLNLRIKKMDYGYYNDKNKPSPISVNTLNSDNNNLKQKGLWI